MDKSDELIELLKDVPLEVLQEYSDIWQISIQFAKNNEISKFMKCRDKLKEISSEHPQLSKLKHDSLEILREIKLRNILK